MSDILIHKDTRYLLLYVTWIWVLIIVMSVNFYSMQNSPYGERMLISMSYGVILASGITYTTNDKIENILRNQNCLTV